MEIQIKLSELEQASLVEVLYQITEGEDVKCNGIQLRELASALVKIEGGLVIENGGAA